MTEPNAATTRPSVALIGYRGCGKSAVGRELAALLGIRFVDTDELIVHQAGQSIAAIFEKEGEDGFRRRERETVKQLAQDPRPGVISVGGGAVLDQNNVRTLGIAASLVWLNAPAEVLWQRIDADPDTTDMRPPLTDKTGIDEVRFLLAQRLPYYRRAADLVIDAAGGNPRTIADEIAKLLGHRTGE